MQNSPRGSSERSCAHGVTRTGGRSSPGWPLVIASRLAAKAGPAVPARGSPRIWNTTTKRYREEVVRDGGRLRHC